MSKGDDDCDLDAEIIPFVVPKDDPDGPIHVKRPRYDRCRHAQIDVDDDLRRVVCRGCKEVVDPINIILNWRVYFSRLAGRERHLKNEWERWKRERERARAKTTYGATRKQVLAEIEDLIVHAEDDGDTKEYVSGWRMGLECLRDNLRAEWEIDDDEKRKAGAR